MSSKLKMFVNDPVLWGSFLEELDQRIANGHKKLEQITDLPELYRTQGQVEALKSMQRLRDKVNGG